MRTVAEWLGDYGAGHENRANELLHWVCVPLIVLTLFGLQRGISPAETVARLLMQEFLNGQATG
jgi:uncharacterized membrane protein YGL010W